MWRNTRGTSFKKVVDAGRSIAADKHRTAKRKVPSGRGRSGRSMIDARKRRPYTAAVPQRLQSEAWIAFLVLLTLAAALWTAVLWFMEVL